MDQNDRYAKRGVSSDKEDVHAAIKNIDKGLFPNAFCKIVPDYLADSPNHCIVMHADGAGTKSSLAYMYWRETGDISVWRGIAQDAVIRENDCGTSNGVLVEEIIESGNIIPTSSTTVQLALGDALPISSIKPSSFASLGFKNLSLSSISLIFFTDWPVCLL